MAKQITEHVDDIKAAELLNEFYKNYHGRSYGLFEMVASVYEAGYKEGKEDAGLGNRNNTL